MVSSNLSYSLTSIMVLLCLSLGQGGACLYAPECNAQGAHRIVANGQCDVLKRVPTRLYSPLKRAQDSDSVLLAKGLWPEVA